MNIEEVISSHDLLMYIQNVSLIDGEFTSDSEMGCGKLRTLAS